MDDGCVGSTSATHDDSWRQGVQRLGFDILHRISKACTVTPTTIAATVLLNHHGRGISQSSLTEQSQWMLEFLDEEAARFSSPLQHQATREAAVLEAVEKLVDDGTVSVERPGRGDAEPRPDGGPPSAAARRDARTCAAKSCCGTW